MDLLTEIYVSMSRNKLRIALTGFSIAWGIFLLIVLLSAGDGFLNAMKQNFASDTVNTIRVSPGWTSEPFEGLPRDRRIKFDENIKNLLSSEFSSQIIDAFPTVSKGVSLSYGEFSTSTEISAYDPKNLKWQRIKIKKGRDLNNVDIKDCRKVILVDEETLKLLMPKESNPVGKWINVGKIPFQIAGVYSTENAGRADVVFAPKSTVGIIFNPEGTYNSITLVTDRLETTEENEEFNKKIRETIANYRRFNKDDWRAVWVRNSYEQFLEISKVMKGLDMFIWLIGIASLIAGIVGVSNIMLITVRERTREFGIRKALGASPRSILMLVLLESIGITMLFGYIGMILGLGLVNLVITITYAVQPSAEQVFATPTVPLGIVFAANVTMIIAGIIAGYIPAKRAVSIKPVEALAAL